METKIKNLITAEQARELAGPTAEEIVEAVMPYIREAAEKKRRKLFPHQQGLNQNFWINGGYNLDQKWLDVKNILKGLGYTVDFFYEERQFVDMYTIISW